jgi:tRNA threonylcarbamoyl adenosine modification protein YeaZ
MIKVILDTSNQYLAVAIYKDEVCLDSIVELGSQRQSENAIPYLSKLCDKHNIELLDVDEMIITRGPGSYTGVRVAMTIAKTLSVVSPVKVKAISSLKAYAGKDKCVSVIDARSQKVFVCAYDNGKELIHEQMIKVSDFDEFMKDYPDFKVVGQTQVVNRQEEKINLIDNLFRLSIDEEDVNNIDMLTPVYLKDVEAKKICL